MKLAIIIAVAIGVLVAIVIAAILLRRPQKEQGYVVLGEEFAKAKAADEARKRKGGTGTRPSDRSSKEVHNFWRLR
jgi:beta-lactam-binding protein with PASTA domain